MHDKSFFNNVYDLLPEVIRNYFNGRDVLTYLVAAPIILLILLAILRLITLPVYNHLIMPLSEKLYNTIRSMGRLAQRIAGALWRIPKALVITLLVALALNLSTYFLYSPDLSAWLNNSTLYSVIYNHVLYPVMNSNIAKQIPVIVNDSFRRTTEIVLPNGSKAAGDTLEQVTGGRVRIIEYFNGVTLDEAVKSSSEIDAMANSIVGTEKDGKKKAYLIYKWISKNIKYDYDKAEVISENSKGIESGSVVAFETRSGICFDFSCLYISMCHTVGLKTRILTGLGYSGKAWGDHSWNQVYDKGENRWVNVDCTFGASGINYFDKHDFGSDHSDEEVQGEW